MLRSRRCDPRVSFPALGHKWKWFCPLSKNELNVVCLHLGINSRYLSFDLQQHQLLKLKVKYLPLNWIKSLRLARAQTLTAPSWPPERM